MVLTFEEEVIRVILFVHMLPRLEDHSARKINFIKIWQVSGICKILVRWFLV